MACNTDYPQHIRHCVWREMIECLCVEDCAKLFIVHKPWEPKKPERHIAGIGQVSTRVLRSRRGSSMQADDDATLGGCGPEIQTQKLFIALKITAGGCDEKFSPWDANVLVGQIENEIIRVLCACSATTHYMSAVELESADYRNTTEKDESGGAIISTADLLLSVSYTCKWC